MPTLPPSAVLEMHMNVLGKDAGRLYNALWNEILRMRVKWEEYCGLFRAGPKTLSTLNSAAPFFFYLVQELMINDVILSLSRITGPKQSVGKANLAIAWLPEKMPDEADLPTIGRLVSAAWRASRFTKDRRNRYIAHRDYALFVKGAAKPIQPIRYQQVENAFKALWKIVEHLEAYYFKSSTIDHVVRPLNGVSSLLYYLSEARQKTGRPT